MSDKINAGVVLINRFVSPTGKAFNSYINYIDRDEATRNEHYMDYSIYQKYMDNPNKTTDLFTADKDKLSNEEKQNLKKAFQVAQKNGSLMWQTVLSFDNRFLEDNGILNSETMKVDEEKLKELTRGCMDKMLSKEDINNTSIWSAAVHYNTENLHIHIATVEPVPTREKYKNEAGKEVYRGKFKNESMKSGKRYVVNHILHEQKENELINDLIRNVMVKDLKGKQLNQDKELSKLFTDIYRSLPNDKRKWKYNMNALEDIRPAIDLLSKKYIEYYHKEDFEALKKYLNIQQEKYKTAYGVGKKGNNRYTDNKMKDMYTRMGNAILNNMKQYDKEKRADFYKKIKNNSKEIKNATGYKSFKNNYLLMRGLNKLKNSLYDEYKEYRNMVLYQQLENQIVYDEEKGK